MHVECREVSAAEQKGWNLHHSPDAGHHRIKYCYWVSLQRSALERLYQPHPPPSHPPVLLQMLVPTSSPLIWVCWLIWWSTCCSSMRSCCSRSAEGNCFPWAATSDMDSLSLGDWKIRRFQKKIFTPLAQKKIDKRHSRKRQRKKYSNPTCHWNVPEKVYFDEENMESLPSHREFHKDCSLPENRRKPHCFTTKSPFQSFSQHRTRQRRRKASPLFMRSWIFLLIKWTQKYSLWPVSNA